MINPFTSIKLETNENANDKTNEKTVYELRITIVMTNTAHLLNMNLRRLIVWVWNLNFLLLFITQSMGIRTVFHLVN